MLPAVGLVAWHLGDVGRRADAQGLEGQGRVSGEFGTGQIGAAVQVDLDRRQLGQVLEEVVIADLRFHRGQLPAERGLQDQGEETDHHVAPDPLRGPVVDGPEVEPRLQFAEGPFDLPEALVGLGRVPGGEEAVRPEDILAVIPGLGLDGVSIDGDPGAIELQVSPEGAVADELLGPPGTELLLELGQGLRADLGVAPGLLGIEADDVAPAFV